MSLKKLLTAGVALSALTLTAHTADAQQRTTRQAPPAPAAQAPTAAPQGPDQLRLLQRQIDDLRKELYDLEVKYNNTNTDFQRFPTIELNNGRPIFRSRDRAFEFRLEGRVHFDWAHYDQDSPTGADIREPAGARDLNSGTNFRRIRLGALGKFAEDWEFSLIGEWGGSGAEASSLDEAMLAYTGFKPFQIRIGAFKPGSNMDDNASSNDIKFIERPSPANLDSSFAAGTARKSLEVLATGPRYMARASVTGETYGSAELNDEQLGATTRVAFLAVTNPDLDVHIGAGAAFIIDPPQNSAGANVNQRQTFQLRDRPELRVDADRLIDTGVVPIDSGRTMHIELATRYRNFWVGGEYFWYRLNQRNELSAAALPNVDFKGYYIQAAWVITGEAQRYDIARGSYRSPQPRANFKPGVSPGAWELALRYSMSDLNDAPETGALTAAPGLAGQFLNGVRGGEQEIITVGVNWYLNRNVRVMFNYLNVDVDRLNAAGLQVGQKYDAFAIRTQYNF